MRIEQPHSLGRQEASERIDRFLDSLMRQRPPGGVTVKDPQKSWVGHTMNFSFTAAKGMFGTAIRGLMHVHEDRVVVESELPALVKSFVGEGRIKDVISRELGRILA
jgi:hypothetical protein